jgi:hypothetical protein
MKQGSLWSSDDERARAGTWKRLPEQVRTEVVAQLGRLIVKSLLRVDENQKVEEERKR